MNRFCEEQLLGFRLVYGCSDLLPKLGEKTFLNHFTDATEITRQSGQYICWSYDLRLSEPHGNRTSKSPTAKPIRFGTEKSANVKGISTVKFLVLGSLLSTFLSSFGTPVAAHSPKISNTSPDK
jgi:hypothetical protein